MRASDPVREVRNSLLCGDGSVLCETWDEDGSSVLDVRHADRPARRVLQSTPACEMWLQRGDVGSSAIASLSTWTAPRQLVRVELSGPTVTRLGRSRRTGREPSVRRVHARGHDGARIPITLIDPHGSDASDPMPMYLYTYGHAGVSTVPFFDYLHGMLLRSGVRLAVTHVRGGGELGPTWGRQGRSDVKLNSFLDLLSSLDALVETGQCRRDQLVISGASGGGMLVLGAMAMRPDLASGVVAHVPVTDPLSTMLQDDSRLRRWKHDMGDPRDPVGYQRMKAWAPYDNLEPADYPNVLVTAGALDSRLRFTDAAKFVAKLREVRTNDNLLLLRTAFDRGHFPTERRLESLRDTAYDAAFILRSLGTLT
jgi:oligopeptidase B